MNIDGNIIRTDSIDGVTEIEITVGGVHEGTDKMARGKFQVLVHGQRLDITRGKRFPSDGDKAAAVKVVRDQLTEIWDPIKAVIS